MARFHLETFILAGPEVVFDLSRSIDLHLVSTAHTREKATAGITSGLIGMGEFVTWEAFHLFKKRSFTSVITQFDYPHSFTDKMTKGDLRAFSHYHSFESSGSGTLMKDAIDMQAPYGPFGTVVTALFLKQYFRRLLIRRNSVIKEVAENGTANEFLKTQRSE